IVSGPEVHAKGVAEDDEVFDKIKPQIAQALETAMKEGVVDHHQLQQIVRRTIGRWVGTKLRRKAMIVPVVVVV
ncbi:MAG: RNase J family beta-CASP ribonuclease, partial [Microbacteriaceae bacterium]|nr:RNase J family beta-CASP ribonuclease [Microbacteriaceae bacterium]